MSTPMIPQTYQQWQHCITVECGLTLTPAYIEKRIQALSSEKDEHTRQFVQKYGPEYHQQVLAWFKQAQVATV